MRCNECNVDLGEEYKRCPLCGAPAIDAEPMLKGIKTAEYPKYDDEKLLNQKAKMHCDFYPKYMFPVCCVAAVAFIVAAIAKNPAMWTVGVPALYAVTCFLYFVFGLFQKKGTLLYSCEYMIKLTAIAALSLIAAAIARCGAASMAVSLAVCLLCFILLTVIRPVRMKAQITALFHMS